MLTAGSDAHETDALSRLEAGGGVPTIPLLERISVALDAASATWRVQVSRDARALAGVCRKRRALSPCSAGASSSHVAGAYVRLKHPGKGLMCRTWVTALALASLCSVADAADGCKDQTFPLLLMVTLQSAAS